MPIEALFARNVDAIGRFLTDGARTLLVLQRDADMEMVVKRLLVDAVACARDAVVLTKARLVRIELCLLRKNIFRWPSLNHL